MDWERLLNLAVSAMTIFAGLAQLRKDSKRLGLILVAFGVFVVAAFLLTGKGKDSDPSPPTQPAPAPADPSPPAPRPEAGKTPPVVPAPPPEPILPPGKPGRPDDDERHPRPPLRPIPRAPRPNPPDPYLPPPPPRRPEERPPPPPAPAEVGVEALARLENFRVPDGRPFLALEEEIELTIAGRKVQLSLARRGPWQASEAISLPEGEHRYTLRSTARARCYPEGGGWPFALPLTGGGTGKLVVKRGARLLLKREVCQGRHYTARLEPCE
jgi:hypothetical protein